MEETPQEDSDSLFSDDLSLGEDDNSNEEVSQVDTIQPAPFGSPLRGKDSKKNSIQASTPQHFRKGSDLISRPDMIQKTSRMWVDSSKLILPPGFSTDKIIDSNDEDIQRLIKLMSEKSDKPNM